MTPRSRSIMAATLAMIGLIWANQVPAQVLTADRAVEMALARNTDVINAEASIVNARAGWYGALSGVLPSLSASLTRSGFKIENQVSGTGRVTQGGIFIPPGSDFESYTTSPTLSGSWNVLNLASLTGVSSARNSVRAANLERAATRQAVALVTRRQFYEVVKAIQLANVASEALKLARDDTRRVNALFEVGSVSKSDVLSAEVRSAQSELDSLKASQLITIHRITLANLIGVPEAEMRQIDTVLTVEPQTFDEAQVLAEAERARPDIQAAEAEKVAARAGLLSAQFARLPYLTLSGSATFNRKGSSKTTFFDVDTMTMQPFQVEFTDTEETDRQLGGQIALNLDLFDGFGMESRIASARARKIRAEESHDALRRNLRGEVRQALITYREALERSRVAQRAIESAVENMKLTQQKYNVGSATILELIDAQVQLQRAQSDRVSALADIRVAEAEINRVQGRGD